MSLLMSTGLISVYASLVRNTNTILLYITYTKLTTGMSKLRFSKLKMASLLQKANVLILTLLINVRNLSQFSFGKTLSAIVKISPLVHTIYRDLERLPALES